jgi:hypothetical protein
MAAHNNSEQVMSTPEEIRAHNDQVLRNVERIELVAKFAESIGCSAEQASTISKAYAEKFTFDGAVLAFNGKPVTQAKDDVLAHFRDNHLEFLLPSEKSGGKPDVNVALLEKARGEKIKLSDGRKVGDITAYGQLVREHGKAAIDVLLAEKPNAGGDGKTTDADPAFKNKKNPWRAESWSVTEQGRIIRSLGLAVAGRMAAAANSKIGATKPSRIAS